METQEARTTQSSSPVDRMTGRQRIERVVARQPTDRLPMGTLAGVYPQALPALESYLGVKGNEAVLEALGVDDRWAFVGTASEIPPGSGKWHTVWGTTDRLPDGSHAGYSAGVSPRPLSQAATVSDVEAYPWPTADDFDVDTIPLADQAHLRSYSLMYEAAPPIFDTLCQLMGVPEALMLLLTAPAAVEAAVTHISDICLELGWRALDRYGDLLHQVYVWDDVSDSRGPLFNPCLWRRFFRPQLARQIALIKSRGLIAHYHCCGAMSWMIPDLIDMGIDILDPMQVHLPGMEPERLKREYGRHLVFWGGINTQRTLPFGTPEQVRAEVRYRARVLGQGGGYVLAPDHTLMPDAPVANVVALFAEGRRCMQEG
jgi:uroporphyrinogen decarboxylase